MRALTVGGLVLTLLLVLEFPSQAQGMNTGNDAITMLGCTGEKPHSSCVAYVAGVVGGVCQHEQLLAAEAGRTDPRNCHWFCPPAEGIPPSQVARIVVKFLREHPELLHMSAPVLVMRAMTEAFPCPAKP